MRSSDEDARSLPFVPSVCKPKMRHEQLLFVKMKTTLDVRDRTHLVVDVLSFHESSSLGVFAVVRVEVLLRICSEYL